jgi:SagB-type dehydrogenase family enzyme
MDKQPKDPIKARIALGRSIITKFSDDESVPETYMTDQELKKPQPPLAKAPMTDRIIDLPNDFGELEIRTDFLGIINDRKSHRVYTDQPLTLRELSYLLWCTQGVKDVRGKSYATIRTVPCGGARHEFECYMAIRRVEGLEPGLYHYLPMTHQIEFLGESADMGGFISKSLQEQNWALKSSVVFYYSCVFYRAEWRYGPWAHPVILMDSGHITENLYLAATSIGLGGCAIAAVDGPLANSEQRVRARRREGNHLLRHACGDCQSRKPGNGRRFLRVRQAGRTLIQRIASIHWR